MGRKKTIINIGDVFGDWTVKSEGKTLVRKDHGTRRTIVCSCRCGLEKEVYLDHLKNGFSRSCGNYDPKRAEYSSSKKLGILSKRTREYRSWQSMKTRCYNKNAINYKNYGGRGISICDEWKRSFDIFLEDMGNRPMGSSLDRIDVNGNYCKENCRWATPSEQIRNRRV